MGTQRLTLANGDWLDVKDTLKVKDTRKIHDWVKSGMDKNGEDWHFNPMRWAAGNAAARIMAWSVTGAKPWPGPDKAFTDKIDVIEDLDEPTFDAISKRLTEFVDAQKAKGDEEKNATAADGSSS